MVWLATHIWMLLAGAALIGLLLGLGLRGLMLGGKARRALVERDVALTELDQARTEIEGLYSSQRRVHETGDSDTGHLRDELAAREAKVATLTEELFRSREEIDALKAGRDHMASGAGMAAAGAVAGAAATAIAGGAVATESEAEPDEASLEWRNRYLESRVRRLEQDLAAATQTSAVVAVDTGAETTQAEMGDAGTESAPGPDPTDVAKLRWQNDYLQTRVKVLEEKLVTATAAVGAPLVDDAGMVTGDAGLADEPAPAGDAGRTETADEELARLRWRNRYLEGRLAYLEEGNTDAASAESVPVAAAATAALAAGGAALAGSLVGSDDEAEPAAVDGPVDVVPGPDHDLDLVTEAVEPETAIEVDLETEAVVETAAEAETAMEDVQTETFDEPEPAPEMLELVSETDVETAPLPEPEAEAEPVMETDTELEPVDLQPELELAPEIEVATEAETEVESVEDIAAIEVPVEAEPVVEAVEVAIEPEAEPEPEAVAIEVDAEPVDETGEVAVEPELEAEPEPVADLQIEAEAETDVETETETETETEAEAEAIAADVETWPFGYGEPPALFEPVETDPAAEAELDTLATWPIDRENPPALFAWGDDVASAAGYVPAFASDPDAAPPAAEVVEAVEAEAAESVELEAVEAEVVEPVEAEAVEVEPVADEAEVEETVEAAPIAMERPPAISKPRDGGDDLAEIGGIGPRIRDVLQELGIYRYSQIAAWTPENEAWIDDYLSFSGRVGRERWVEQARVLAEQAEQGEGGTEQG